MAETNSQHGNRRQLDGQTRHAQIRGAFHVIGGCQSVTDGERVKGAGLVHSGSARD